MPETAAGSAKASIGVALSGSGLLLGAHIGALQAIVDANIDIADIAGTSGGAIIAACYAGGLSLDAMRSLYLTADFRSLVPISAGPIALIRLFLTKGLVNPAPFRLWLSKTLGGKTFGQTRIPCTLLASNLNTESSQIWSTRTTPAAPLWEAAFASAAFPLVFPPVCYNNAYLQDGGLYDDIPVDMLTTANKLAVMVGGRARPIDGVPSLLGLLVRDVEILFLANNEHVLNGAASAGTAIAYAECKDIPIFDVNITVKTREALIESGYQAAKDALARFNGVQAA
jgi:NTE family protein